MPSPKNTKGPIVKTGPTAGQVRSRNTDGQWRKKRSDAGKKKWNVDGALEKFNDIIAMNIRRWIKMMNSFTKKGASMERKIKPTPPEMGKKKSGINISGKKSNSKDYRIK